MAIISQKIGAIEYLTAEGICVPHGFTTRYGGVSTGHLASMNIGIHRGDELENVIRNYELLGQAIGFDPENVVAAKQIHSDIIYRATEEDRGKCFIEGASPVCDGLITNEPEVALTVFSADCTPVLLYDPVAKAIGAVHAGWRGTAAGIVRVAVEKMKQEFGCKGENIRAAIGQCISACCFLTDADVPEAMLAALGVEAQEAICPAGEKFRVDLKKINSIWLRREGVSQIDISTDCTACQPERFWSHRVVKDRRGSLAAVIMLKK